MENNNLDGKIALVTGATSGMGKAIATTLAKKEIKVIINGITQKSIDDTIIEIKKEVPKALLCPLVLDISKFEEVTSAISALPSDFKDIDILINNAGISAPYESFYNIDLRDLEKTVQVNVMGTLAITRAVLPIMIQKNSGFIISTSSMGADYNVEGLITYSATKSFIAMLGQGLTDELRGTNIKVTVLKPGAVNTNFGSNLVKSNQNISKLMEYQKKYEGIVPLNAQDIASTIEYILSLPLNVVIPYIAIMPLHSTSHA